MTYCSFTVYYLLEVSYIKSKSFKIVSRFYVIYGDYSPVYVGYTNRTVKQRFKEHERDKDFSDYENVEVKELTDEKLSFDFTWDYNQTCKNADKVSLREGQLVQQYGTQDSEFQKADGGGQTWATEKWFVKCNKDNSRFTGLSGSEIKARIEKENVISADIYNFVSTMKYQYQIDINSFVKNMESQCQVDIYNFVNHMKPQYQIDISSFISTIKPKYQVDISSFVSTMEPKYQVDIHNFVGNMELQYQMDISSFAGTIKSQYQADICGFVKNMKPQYQVDISGFVKNMKFQYQVDISNFVNDMKYQYQVDIHNFINNMKWRER